MGREYSPFHAAACICNLPLGSALMSAIDERASWTITDYKLHQIINMLSTKKVPYPWESSQDKKHGESDKLPLKAVAIEDFNRIYNETEWRDDGSECI